MLTKNETFILTACIIINGLIERYAGAELSKKEFLHLLNDQVKDLRKIIRNANKE